MVDRNSTIPALTRSSRAKRPAGIGGIVRPHQRRVILPILWLIATAAVIDPAAAATAVVPVHAKPVKPLTLTSVQNLDLGTITLAPGTWSGGTIGISRAGVFTCSNSNVLCTGATKVAIYTVSGSNNEVVKISAPNVTLTNQGDPTKTLTLVVDSPGSVTLETGGKKGIDFSIGGSIAVSSATAGGLYTGTFNVTVDY
jgi:Domain of unknown function (DUF4402)